MYTLLDILLDKELYIDKFYLFISLSNDLHIMRIATESEGKSSQDNLKGTGGFQINPILFLGRSKRRYHLLFILQFC